MHEFNALLPLTSNSLQLVVTAQPFSFHLLLLFSISEVEYVLFLFSFFTVHAIPLL